MKSKPVPTLKKEEQGGSPVHGNPISRPRSSGPHGAILTLQRTIGNRTIERLKRSGVIHAKLRIGLPNDTYEQEADRVADQVMRMPKPEIRPQPT